MAALSSGRLPADGPAVPTNLEGRALRERRRGPMQVTGRLQSAAVTRLQPGPLAEGAGCVAGRSTVRATRAQQDLEVDRMTTTSTTTDSRTDGEESDLAATARGIAGDV